MIKHIVFFKFRESTTEAQARELARDLAGLREKISCVRYLEVAFDVGRKPNSHDLVLYGHFDSLKDLEAYSVHPAHVEVVKQVKVLCESSCKVDYKT